MGHVVLVISWWTVKQLWSLSCEGIGKYVTHVWWYKVERKKTGAEGGAGLQFRQGNTHWEGDICVDLK